MENPFNLPESDECNYKPYKLPTVNNNILLLADLHSPYHSISALTCAINYGKEQNINTILLNGDVFDFYQLSRFTRDPRKRSVKIELDCVRQLLDVFAKEFPVAKIFWKYGNHCFDNKTDVLTTKGWKNGMDINYEDSLATLNIDKNIIEYQKPDDIIIREYNGIMYLYSENNFDFNITEGHRLLYNTCNSGNGDFKLEEIKNINFSNSKRIWMKQTVPNNNLEYNISDDKLELLAWIYSDGWLSHIENRAIGYNISQSKEDNIIKIEALLQRLGINYSKKERNKIVKEICGKKLKSQKINYQIRILRGRRKKRNKIIPLFLDDIIKERYILPELIYKLSKRQFDHFLNIIMLADGSRHRDTKAFCIYGNKIFIDQLQVLCMLNGYRSSIYTYRETQYRLNITPNCYRSCIDKSGTKIKKYNHKCLVWCATVPNSTLVTRRNGKILISGNCKRYENYLKIKAPELLDIEEFRLDILLGLGARGIEVIKDERIIMAGKLVILHGHEFQRGSAITVNPARTALLKCKHCVIVSHSHTTSEDCKNKVTGEMLTAWSTGCLSELNPEYARINEWNHGFAHILIDQHGGFNVNNKRIYKGVVV